MIDLNVRLESSLQVEDLRILAKNAGINFDDDFVKSLEFKDEESYQNRRNKILSLLNNEDNIKKAVDLILRRYYLNHYYYLEIAFTPYLLKNCSLSLRRRVKALMNGINDFIKEHDELEVNVILYAHRDDVMENNRQVVDLAIEYKDQGIVAVGLEGSDRSRRIAIYEKLFAPAKKINYPVVIELGKFFKNNNTIVKAVQIGAKRIIAPYDFTLNESIDNYLIKADVAFEYRPRFDKLLGLNKEESIPLKSLWVNGLKGYISGGAYPLEEELMYLKDYDYLDTQHIFNEMINQAFISSIHQKSVLMRHVVDYTPIYFKKVNKTYSK